MSSTSYKLHIDWSTIAKIGGLVVCLYVLYIIKSIIIWFVFALVIAILFNFLIDALERKKIPRLASAAVLYLGVFALVGFFVYKTAPLMLYEMQDFMKNLPLYLKRISPFFEKLGVYYFQNPNILSDTLQQSLSKAGGSFGNALSAVFGGASSTALVLAMAFFISLERQFVEKLLGAFSPQRYKEYMFSLWRRARKKVSGWFLTRIIGVIFVGALTYIILMILDVKYAFILSVIAGFLDLIPVAGPLVAAVILAAVTALNSTWQAVFVLVAFFFIQQIENHILFPVLFKKLAGLPPVLVLASFAIGGELWGVAGAILGIPLAGVVYEVIKDYFAKKQRDELPESENS
ncbi:MAG: AI-2E family transporter [Patescibacteria group bacterium]|nr:AI-2E family transporter [Patescibacteria group bacterium]